jgi:hypothetical protein
MALFWTMVVWGLSETLALLGIVIAVLGIAAIIIAPRLGSLLQKTDMRTRKIITFDQSLIEQKIATLYSYVGNVKEWARRGVNADRLDNL